MSEQSELDKRVNDWFGLDDDWSRKAHISHSFFNGLNDINTEVKKLDRKRNRTVGAENKQKVQVKIDTLKTKYEEMFKAGPKW